MTGIFTEYIFSISKYAIVFLSVALLLRCLRSMLHERTEPEVWATIRAGEEEVPVTHWENLIGRARSADIRLFGEGISRYHAVLRRSDKGSWFIYDIFSKGGIWVNNTQVLDDGELVQDGDTISLGGSCVRFQDMGRKQREKNEKKRTGTGKLVNPAISLMELTLLQTFLILQHAYSASRDTISLIILSFATLMVLEWCLYEAMRVMDRMGFEIEILALYLTTLGLSVAASSVPSEIYKQILLIVFSVGMFLVCGWWMRNLKRACLIRIPVGILALGLLALNIFTSDPVNGARSWLEFGGYSLQPSEFVKVLYIYVGASTLDVLYRRRNLYAFIVYSAACVVALALIGDFGTALIFFVTFLVISFMRSGSIATVLLAVTGAVLATVLAVTVKPYIARRFATWGHVWEDIYGAGYQQAHAIAAAASGGLVGKGAGAGWLKSITYSETDMVFAFICEEQGLIVGICMVGAVILMALFAVRCSRNGRSAYYSIAACAASAMLLIQLAMNVFGSLDMLPFTGVTFPFVSRGGSSLISCWMMMAYFKGIDNRRDASFAVRRTDKMQTDEERNLLPVENVMDSVRKRSGKEKK